MSAHSPHNHLPLQTGSPSLPRQRRKIRDHTPAPSFQPSATTSKRARQVVTDQDQVASAENECQLLSGNNILSCFPKNDTIIPQHQWATFVWNSRLPAYQYTRLVDIYLFRADSLRQVLNKTDVINPFGQAGFTRAQVDDSWWGDDGSKWNGSNISYPFYWLISPNNEPLNGSQQPQAIFSAVQTTYADSVLASIASSSSAAAASSSASAASASPATTTTAHPGHLQNSNGSSGFRSWAIAVIVVLGFLAIAAICLLIFLVLRRIRRRQQMDSNRNSMGSASPMMANVQQQSPVVAAAPLSAQAHSSIGHQAGVPPSVLHDGASTISRPGSAADAGPFSGADAAIMADAFRKMLRKPDFTGPVEEDIHEPEVKEDLITRELAEEGRDIRSVSSSRGRMREMYLSLFLSWLCVYSFCHLAIRSTSPSNCRHPCIACPPFPINRRRIKCASLLVAPCLCRLHRNLIDRSHSESTSLSRLTPICQTHPANFNTLPTPSHHMYPSTTHARNQALHHA
ncbi:hypothetical protein APHAL10511_002266 [Amanita phalloides]|nr:hypothetical protein APHAL10511_002266 [Amanita phalloides]